MRRERVSEDIYIFTSDIYAQVTAGVIITDEGAIVIDTLPFPSESRELRRFIDRKTSGGAPFVINTHRHPDHVYGNYLFPEATIVAHRRCRDGLLREGEQILHDGKAQTTELAEVELRIPNLIFDEAMGVHLGKYSLRLQHMPGHSDDMITVFVEGEKILFAGDVVTPVPYIVWGDWHAARESLALVKEMALESIVQGHGEILLRGEIPDVLQTHMGYLDCVVEHVQKLIHTGKPESELRNIRLEDCGESPIPLDGMVRQMHEANLHVLYQKLSAEAGHLQYSLDI